MNWDKFGKSTTGMMLLFLLRVQDNIILRKWYGETQGPCFDYLEDGDLNIPSETTCSRFYLWTEVCLRAPPFILQLKLLHPCVTFGKINHRNMLQQVLCRLWFIYYLYPSRSFGKYWFKSCIFNFVQENQWNEKF